MNEASKTRRLWTDLEIGILQGKGIDIGCGDDPVTASVRPFDRAHGDANVITQYIHETFDFVFSAHCLEHMRDPHAALLEWWTLVAPGGHLFFIVPDEELYEQGFWPSIFNSDHKATFTMARPARPSPVSVNVNDLIATLPGCQVVDVRLHDQHYDRSCLMTGTCKRAWARLFRSVRWHAVRGLARICIRADLLWIARAFRVPVDQTIGRASAQVQVIVRKRPDLQ